ncbi:ABC transporter ATP-binding protein [Devosia sp. A369]
MTGNLLQFENVSKTFFVRDGMFGKVGTLSAVKSLSFTVVPGEVLALVGESGCGKSTVGRMSVGLMPATSGSITVNGNQTVGLSGRKLREVSKDAQLIFQDPYSSLNPRIRAWESVAEPLIGYGICTMADARERVAAMFDLVGLRRDQLDRFPHEFSGGQRQRIGIARALIVEPKLLVADEPVSALDVSVQAQILNLLKEMHERINLGMLFISHDLHVVAQVADRVAVMYLGEIVEIGAARDVLGDPQHPYTVELLKSLPRRGGKDGKRSVPIEGDLPSPLNPPSGCRFHPRCPKAEQRCREEHPALRSTMPGRETACLLYGGAIA